MASRHATVGQIAVVVPLKSFDSAKARMAAALDPAARRSLAESMAATVLGAIRTDGSAAYVVTDDPEVASWATQRGAHVVRPPETGLDQAARSGVAAATAAGHRRIVIAHGDLPLATSFAHLAERPEAVVLVADRHGDGTNVIVLDASSDFEFAYGPGSFGRHVAEATRLGSGLAVVDDEALAWDVDVPDDLTLNGRPAG